MIARTLVLLLALGLACDNTPRKQTAPVSNQAASVPSQALEPPPPSGVVVPAVGRPRDVEQLGPSAATTWKASFDVVPTDPRIVAMIAKVEKENGFTIKPGRAGAELYVEQIKAGGIECLPDGYKIQGGALWVSIISDRDDIKGLTPSSFELAVGVPGG